MKKIIVLILAAVLLLIVFFIPVTQQKSLLIKSSFFNVYKQLTNADKWKNWRPDLRKAYESDSTKIVIKKDSSSFTIDNAAIHLQVKSAGSEFTVSEQDSNKTVNYSYSVIPDKFPNKTWITVFKHTNIFGYLTHGFGQVTFSDTHADDLKNFMETDSLIYGYKIYKTRVPESNLIVIRKEVLAKDKFSEAAAMFATLQHYVATHGLKQTQPVIAQFLPKGTTDSAQVNIGLFIDREIGSDKVVTFTRMPKGGPLYSAKFKGKFSERKKAYAGLQQYFTDHLYQSAILPFETYLDNKLPTSDTGKVNMQINFTSFF
jgi:effector-binding domain-containing protein/Zn/Cd-binding protein ZinT